MLHAAAGEERADTLRPADGIDVEEPAVPALGTAPEAYSNSLVGMA
jgi:hypothetical protein